MHVANDDDNLDKLKLRKYEHAWLKCNQINLEYCGYIETFKY